MSEETKQTVQQVQQVEHVEHAERILARITPILALDPIDGADKIILATVMDWKVIVRKVDNFAVGDLAIYFAIDSRLEDYEETKHLKNKPLKTIKMRGVFSQGLLAPLSWLLRYDPDAAKDNYARYREDMDVTNLMKVTKSTLEDDAEGGSSGEGRKLPWSIPKTMEGRAQELSRVRKELPGRKVVVTRKDDGCSSTFAHYNGEFAITGRTTTLWVYRPLAPVGAVAPISPDEGKEDSGEGKEEKVIPGGEIGDRLGAPDPTKGAEHYFKIAKRYKLQENMAKLGMNIALRGEIVGPKINKNRMKLKDLDYFVYNIYDIDRKKHLVWSEVKRISALLGLKVVQVIYEGPFMKEWTSMEYLLAWAAKQTYGVDDNGKIIKAEGLVIKTDYDEHEQPRSSFKVISNDYILEHGI